jgi:hypothetical protein
MSVTATQASPQDDPGPVATDGRGHGAALDNLISMGTGIARLLHDQAHAQAAQQAAALAPQATDGQPAPQATSAQPAPAPAPAKAPAPAASLQDLAAAFDSISRTVRRCIMLAQSLDTPKPPARTPAPDRTAARKHILRAVEDTLQRQDYDDSYRDCDPTEVLHAELLDRMDAPDLDRDIANRPIDDIIKDILRDLGLAALPGTRPWKRRTPADIAELCARAAAPSRPAGSTGRGPGPGPQDGRPATAQRPPDPADQREPGQPSAARPQPAPIHPRPGLPKDPAEAVAFVLRHAADTHWRLPPED